MLHPIQMNEGGSSQQANRTALRKGVGVESHNCKIQMFHETNYGQRTKNSSPLRTTEHCRKYFPFK